MKNTFMSKTLEPNEKEKKTYQNNKQIHLRSVNDK